MVKLCWVSARVVEPKAHRRRKTAVDWADGHIYVRFKARKMQVNRFSVSEKVVK